MSGPRDRTGRPAYGFWGCSMYRSDGCHYRDYPFPRRTSPELSIQVAWPSEVVVLPLPGAEEVTAACGGVDAVLAATGVDMGRAVRVGSSLEGGDAAEPMPQPLLASVCQAESDQLRATSDQMPGGDQVRQPAASSSLAPLHESDQAQVPAAEQPSTSPAGGHQQSCSARGQQAGVTFKLEDYEHLRTQLLSSGSLAGLTLLSTSGTIPPKTLLAARCEAGRWEDLPDCACFQVPVLATFPTASSLDDLPLQGHAATVHAGQ